MSLRQNYGLWRYVGLLMTGGVQAARAKPRHGYAAFPPPSLWLRRGQSRKARSVRDSAARKIARRVHVSAALARAEPMAFVGMLLKHRTPAPRVAAELEEIAMLLGSTPTTKKAQRIFKGAQRIREAEAVVEIELAWHGDAAKPAGGRGACGRAAGAPAERAAEKPPVATTGSARR